MSRGDPWWTRSARTRGDTFAPFGGAASRRGRGRGSQAAGAALGMRARASSVSEQAHGGAPRAPGHRAGLALPCVWGAEPAGLPSLPLVLGYSTVPVCVRAT